jgi:acetyl esterase
MRTRWIRVFLGVAAAVLVGFANAEANSPESVAPNESVYRTIDGRELRAFVFPSQRTPDGARPAILMVQGGAWSRGTPEQLFRAARFFSQNGFVPVVIEYRLADERNSPVESFSDVCHALSFLRSNANQLGILPSRIAAWGISSSGQLVAAAATAGCGSQGGGLGNGGPDAVLLVSPVVDAVADRLFRRLMEGHGNPASLSPTHTLTRRVAPVLIAQGDADQTTTLERSKAFCDRAQGLGGRCELVTFEGMGHVLDRPSRDRALELHVAFLRDIWRQ